MNPEHLRWCGQGPNVLFLPGWNTPAKHLEDSIPEWFQERWRCAVLEWPGMGARGEEPPPDDMDGPVREVSLALDRGPFAGIVGCCLGGVAAWESARQEGDRVPLVVMAETPYHFPAVLLPVTWPHAGAWAFRLFTRTRAGQRIIERALFNGKAHVPMAFWEAFGRTDPWVAQAYLRILKRYDARLPAEPDPPHAPCHRILGEKSPRILAWRLGPAHRIHSVDVLLKGIRHFPALEDPEQFFGTLALHLREARPMASPAAARR